MNKGLLSIVAGLLLGGCVVAAEPVPSVVYGPPPPPIVEVVPVAPGPAYIWVQGGWVRGGHGYTWHGGHWAHRTGWRR